MYKYGWTQAIGFLLLLRLLVDILRAIYPFTIYFHVDIYSCSFQRSIDAPFFFFFFYIYVLPLPPGSRYIKNDLDWLYLLATDSTILAYITTLAVAKILIKMCNWCLC